MNGFSWGEARETILRNGSRKAEIRSSADTVAQKTSCIQQLHNALYFLQRAAHSVGQAQAETR